MPKIEIYGGGLPNTVIFTYTSINAMECGAIERIRYCTYEAGRNVVYLGLIENIPDHLPKPGQYGHENDKYAVIYQSDCLTSNPEY